jgi:hypothetical protein
MPACAAILFFMLALIASLVALLVAAGLMVFLLAFLGVAAVFGMVLVATGIHRSRRARWIAGLVVILIALAVAAVVVPLAIHFGYAAVRSGEQGESVPAEAP